LSVGELSEVVVVADDDGIEGVTALPLMALAKDIFWLDCISMAGVGLVWFGCDGMSLWCSSLGFKRPRKAFVVIESIVMLQ
jgi:hypothetical protein